MWLLCVVLCVVVVGSLCVVVVVVVAVVIFVCSCCGCCGIVVCSCGYCSVVWWLPFISIIFQIFFQS